MTDTAVSDKREILFLKTWTADFLILIITNFHFMTQHYTELQFW